MVLKDGENALVSHGEMASIHDLAPSYVHDTLADEDVEAYKDHLASCVQCQEDVALLGGRKVRRRFGDLRLEPGSTLQFVILVFAAVLVVVGLVLALG